MSFDPTLWSGRNDVGERGDTTRLFQLARAWDRQPRLGAPVLIGFACDAGVRRNQGRIGAAQGPDAIRRALANLPAHGLAALHDAGNVVCEADALEAAQQALADRVHAVLDSGGLPLVLGGGHEVAWASWQGWNAHARGHAKHKQRLLIVNLDAHFDLRTSRPGSSGTPFDQIACACAEQGLSFDYLCLGVSRLGNTPALFARAAELGVQYVEDTAMQERHLDAVLALLQRHLDAADHVYLTIDLDALPAAVMPAVSAPAPLGVPLTVVEEITTLLRASGKLRLADLAEFNPAHDRDQHGARVAARLAWRVLRGGG